MPSLYKISAQFYIGEEKTLFDLMKAKREELDTFEQIIHENFTPTFGFLEVYRNTYQNNFEIMYRGDEDEMLVQPFPEEWVEKYMDKMFQIGEKLYVELSGVYPRDEDDCER